MTTWKLNLIIPAVLVSLGMAVATTAADRPNIVLILADDLGINDLGCYGRKDQPTSNLDRLASQGIRFTSAYCAQPICSPSRAAIMTGKTPARLHLTTFLPGRANAKSQMLLHPKIEQQLPLAELTIAERLKEAGYATGCFGKWHLGGAGFGPKDQGFEEYFAGTANTKPSATEGGKGEYELTAKACDFIRRHKDRPFFCYVPHNTPHIPLAAKSELVAKHKAAFHPVYAAMIESLDECVGQVLATLDDLNLAKNTIVIFTSDNGGLHTLEGNNPPATHNTPFRAGKGYVYEGGLRIPFIVRWPEHFKPRVSEEPFVNTDLLPTLLRLAGVTVPSGLDGKDISGDWLGKTVEEGTPAVRTFFWHFPHYTNQGSRPAGTVRQAQWKLIENYEDGSHELYDLSADPSEEHDLAANEPQRVEQLAAKLAAWRKEVGAQENVRNPDFDPDLHRKIYQGFDMTRLPLLPTAADMAEPQREWRKLMDEAIRK